MPKDSNSFKLRFQYYKQTGKLPYKAGRIDDELMYRERMKDVARENYERWGYNSPADAWQDAVNDPTYDYRGYYSDPEFQNVNANSQTHWPDRYKTPFYPTFSSDSKYHGKQSEKNPYGLRGGQWVGDKFIPAAWLNPIRIPHYAGGRDGELPTDVILSRLMPIELQQDPLGMQKRLDIARANAANVTAMLNQAQVGPDTRTRSEIQRGNRQAAIDRQVLREALQKLKNEEAFLNLVNLTSPSTYIGQAIGEPLTGAAALATDALVFGAGAWAGRIYKNILKSTKLGQQDYSKILSMSVSELRNHPIYNKVPSVWKIKEYKVPENIKDAFNTTVTQRFAFPAERQIAHDVLEKPYNVAPDILFEKAGYGSAFGLHFPNTEVISVNKLYNRKPWQLEETLMHELRHRLDNRHLTHINRSVSPLNVAYNDHFATLPLYNERLEGINMGPEVVTTNLDTRNNLLPEYMKHNNYPIKLLNQYINAQDDARIFEALRRSNGYGDAYYNRLQDLGLLKPNIARYLRLALTRIPAVSIPIGLANSQSSK